MSIPAFTDYLVSPEQGSINLQPRGLHVAYLRYIQWLIKSKGHRKATANELLDQLSIINQWVAHEVLNINKITKNTPNDKITPLNYNFDQSVENRRSSNFTFDTAVPATIIVMVVSCCISMAVMGLMRVSDSLFLPVALAALIVPMFISIGLSMLSKAINVYRNPVSQLLIEKSSTNEFNPVIDKLQKSIFEQNEVVSEEDKTNVVKHTTLAMLTTRYSGYFTVEPQDNVDVDLEVLERRLGMD